MTGVQQWAVKGAIAFAESSSAVLTPQVRRSIALGQIVMWARQQDAEPSAKLAAAVIEMGDAVVDHYAKLEGGG